LGGKSTEVEGDGCWIGCSVIFDLYRGLAYDEFQQERRRLDLRREHCAQTQGVFLQRGHDGLRRDGCLELLLLLCVHYFPSLRFAAPMMCSSTALLMCPA
jgi:uncharacterized membrane protein YqaE (UPF0057 family)